MKIVLGGSREIVKIHSRGVYGQRHIGFFELRFDLELIIRESKEPMEFYDFAAKVEVTGHNTNRGGYLGEATSHFSSRIKAYPHSSDVALSLYLNLTLEQINEIEEIRNGHGLTFTLSGHVRSDTNEHVSVSNPGTLKVSQSDWLETLSQMKFRNHMSIEIPLPVDPKRTSLSKAAQHLLAAQGDFLRGDYRNAVAKCREVLEVVTKSLKDSGPVGNAVGNYRNNNSLVREGMGKKERELLLRDVARNYAHLAHHPDPEGTHIDFDRHEARMILSVTAAIFSKSANL